MNHEPSEVERPEPEDGDDVGFDGDAGEPDGLPSNWLQTPAGGGVAGVSMGGIEEADRGRPGSERAAIGGVSTEGLGSEVGGSGRMPGEPATEPAGEEPVSRGDTSD